MIETALAVSIAVGTFGFGIVAGMVLYWWGEHKPLRARYHELVRTLTHMKKQGFVPQYDIEQTKEYDPSEGISES